MHKYARILCVSRNKEYRIRLQSVYMQMNSCLIQYSSGVNWEIPLPCSTLCSCSCGLSVFTLHLIATYLTDWLLLRLHYPTYTVNAVACLYIFNTEWYLIWSWYQGLPHKLQILAEILQWSFQGNYLSSQGLCSYSALSVHMHTQYSAYCVEKAWQ